jgi:hypothetical protein
LFGLIMVLAVTLTAGLKVAEGKAGVRQLLLAAIGRMSPGGLSTHRYIMGMIVRRVRCAWFKGAARY